MSRAGWWFCGFAVFALGVFVFQLVLCVVPFVVCAVGLALECGKP